MTKCDLNINGSAASGPKPAHLASMSPSSHSDGCDPNQRRRSLELQSRIIRQYLNAPQSRKDILREFCIGKRVLDIGCVQHDISQATTNTWLHKMIVEMASYTLGVDYLPEAVKKLAANGYNIILGDVNNPLPIVELFDVIVVGNLIEHLSSFDGLLNNIQRLLSPGGIALISTANPFFREQYFYSALKNSIIVNQEHTCWIDPVTLDQLCARYDLTTTEVRWVREKWNLSDAIFHDERRALDNFTGKWIFFEPPSFVERALSPMIVILLTALMSREKLANLRLKYENLLPRYLYIKALGVFIEIWWRLRRLVIPSSPINEHELFIAVVRSSKWQPGLPT